MHGLRNGGYAPGWTRLLDEWILGFEKPFFPDADERALITLDAVRHTLGDAARRVRWLAGKGDEPVAAGPSGELRFEVAEYDYVVVVRHLVVDDLERFTELSSAALEEACEGAREAMKGEGAEGSGVGVVIATAKTAPLEADALASLLGRMREQTRAACEEMAHGGAWILPGLGMDRLGEANVSDTHPGISLLYKAFGEVDE